MWRSPLEVLRAVEAVEGIGGRISDVRAEAALSPGLVQRYLGELETQGLITRNLREAKLTPKGKEALRKYQGLTPFHCRRCGKELVVAQENAADMLGGTCPDCSGELAGEAFFDAAVDETGPAPTRTNLRGQFVYAYEPFQDEGGHWICGARRLDGQPCKKRAITGSKAKRCAKHGGKTLRGIQVSEGKGYSRYLDGTLGQIYEKFAQDEDQLDMRNELILLRTMLAKKLAEGDPAMGQITRMIDVMGKTSTRISEREQREEFFLTIDRFQWLIDRWGEQVRANFETCPHCGRPLTPLLEEFAHRVYELPMPDAKGRIKGPNDEFDETEE